ncbi:stress protein [Alteromonas sp. CYL-A6]|uniref:stress protein n=1 Tax=Alteromonas nitratireducens TaxID=3390813 RepID=UPI0034BA54EA
MNNNENEHHDTRMTRALNGEYPFDVFALLKRANSVVKQHFGALFQACVVLFVAVIVLSVLLVFGFDITSPDAITPGQRTMMEVLSILVISPLQAGLYMMGVNAARGQPVTTFDIFHYLGSVLVISVTQLIISITTQLGLALFIFPGVYVWTATLFALMLVADKRLTPFQAILLSARMVNVYLGKMLLLAVLFFVLFGTGLLSFGVTLIWVVPLYFCTLGMLYNDLFSTQDVPSETAVTDESKFDA